ncbi:MAG: cytochrome c551/c552 [Lentimonas sp.]|jgi:cytochrome c551/c552
MKISINQMFRNVRLYCMGLLSVAMFAYTFNASAQGEALFKAKCASCHQPHKNGTGPKLFEVRAKWADGGAKDGSIYQWVNNWQVAAATDPYAQMVSTWSPTAMTAFPGLSKEEINSILDWVDVQPVSTGPKVSGPGLALGQEEESSNTWVWILLGAVFAIVIAAVGGVRRQLKHATSIAEGVEVKDGASYSDEFKSWAWRNKGRVGIFTLVALIFVLVSAIQGLGSIGVVEGYQPSQPIEFPHSVHAGINGIDCKYCHNSVTESRSAGLPSVNVCMNCHKQINGATPEQQAKIAKIYAAAGWNPEGAGEYTGKTKEIVWNKVHVLPDHVYFNHSQHVVVGGVDCKQCHGDMAKMSETAKVQTIAELNKVEGNIVLSKPTLTMGWCIECHGEKEISSGSIENRNDGYYNEIHRRLLNNDKKLYEDYLKDGKVTVKELGGWECAKCHY